MKIVKYILYTALGTSLLAGCSKQLDLKPTDGFTEVNAFSSVADAQLGANAVYGAYGAYLNTMYSTALVTDESKIGYDNAGQGALTFRYQYSADGTTGGDVIAAYRGYYSVIDQANRILAKLPGLPASNPSDESRKAILKGQMLGMRALAHFDLLQLYSNKYTPGDLGIPIMLSSNITAQPKRNTMAEVITQVETDFADALALLPAATSSNFTDTVMNQLNINAYRAKVALFKGDYANAITYASTVINANIKPLATGSDYANIWIDGSTSELLFRIRYSTSNAVGSVWTAGNLVYIAPSDKLTASYGTGDIRKAAFIAAFPASGSVPAKPYVNKFFASSRGGRIVDIKAMRISEVYLIRAEAYLKSAAPNLPLAAADLNAVRTARITPYTNVTFADAASGITAILDERFKELCFEGSRLFDLKRNGLSVTRIASDASPAWLTLASGNYRFVFPIPQYELLANPNNTQNPGY
ncbi:MAG: RagB/SusD family nutrient uptake outer membrane protein [Sediminibacterium sp.]|nr:RagB/SusD family nutrient uptake outer membrane protein [Sediminibacterium sp.]